MCKSETSKPDHQEAIKPDCYTLNHDGWLSSYKNTNLNEKHTWICCSAQYGQPVDLKLVLNFKPSHEQYTTEI